MARVPDHMEKVTIYHPELDATETVNVGLAGVLKESGWEVPGLDDVVAEPDEIEVIEGVPRSEAMPEKKSKKKVTKPKKESD